MDGNIIMTDSAMHGTSDISGVKDLPADYPDSGNGSVLRDADEANGTEIGAVGELENEKSPEGNTLEAEFDELIRGRYAEVYKKRTEHIIRKRLRQGRTRPDSAAAPSEAVGEPTVEAPREAAPTENAAPTESQNGISESAGAADGYAAARHLNKNRPIENGLYGSCAMVTKINVSALDGQGVLSIIKRVGSGEKISFK